MNNTKILLVFVLFLIGPNLNSIDAQSNGAPITDLDTLVNDPWIVRGNWPKPYPLTAQNCYDVLTFDLPEFGFGVRVRTTGYFVPGYHPNLYATFIVTFPAFGSVYTESKKVDNEMLVEVGQSQGLTIYEAYAHYFPDFSETCPFTFTEVEYQLMLTEMVGGTHFPYPTHQFTGPGEIFDEVFFDLSADYESGTKNFCCDNGDDDVLTYLGHNDFTAESSGSHPTIVQGKNLNEPEPEILNSGLFVKIFPNPVGDNFNLSFGGEIAERATMEIFDVNGQMVKRVIQNTPAGNSHIQIDMSDFYSGIYTLKIKHEDQIQVLKLLKK